MRVWTLALMVVAAAVILVWRCQSDSIAPTQNRTTPTPQAPPLEPGSQPPRQDKPNTTPAGIPRPDLSPATTGAVSLRREPRLAEETDLQYRLRTEFVIAFDWFRNEAKISDEKERTLLHLLGQAPQKLQAIEAEREPAHQERGKRLESYVHWAPILATEIASGVEEEVSGLLTQQERQPWNRYMAVLVSGVHLQYAQPLHIDSAPDQ